MSSEWPRRTFGDLISSGELEIGDGYRSKNNELSKEGVGPIFLRAGHVTDSHVDFDEVERFIAANRGSFGSKVSRTGDVIVTTKGNSTGRVAFVTAEMPTFVYSPHLSYWRTAPTGSLRQDYLRAWSRSEEFSRQLTALSRSTDMAPYLSLTDQRRLEITIPPEDVQALIGQTADALNDRIGLLRQTNTTLEAIAQALFKSWFVDFDPVRAKAEGREPDGMDAATAALFPSEFEESELGLIPKRWRFSSAGSLFEVGIGRTPPRKEEHWFTEDSCDMPWVSIKDMGDSGLFVGKTSEYLRHEAVEKFNIRRVPAWTVILSFKLTVGRLALTDAEVTTNEAIAHFKAKACSPSQLYLYGYLKQFDFSRLGSTSSIATATNSKAIRELPVLLPESQVVQAFDATVLPLFERVRNQQQKIVALTQLRDALLPRLISGKLRIPEAEALIDEVSA